MDVAIVTGAAKGMGLEWVKQLAEAGYRVVLTASTLAKAEAAAEDFIERELVVYPQKLDVTSAEDRKALAAWAEHMFGRVDLLVNNAGVNSRTRAAGDPLKLEQNLLIEKLDKQELFAVMDINAIAPIQLANELRPLFKHSANPSIINIGSWLGSISIKNTGGNYSYAVSKSALNMMNRAFANDVRAEGICSIVLNPGWVQTDMGGAKAQFTETDAVHNMRKLLEKLDLEDSGKFFNYDGTEHPW
ncbi:MAG: SDR family oxidoreductase [Bacteroidetes bacterium]|nr:MAG: SDR family oxidoreductase [Bacteroidota bacterium]